MPDAPDVLEIEALRRRQALMDRAGERVGSSLDVRETARAIADLLAPSVGAAAFVDLAEEVLNGDEPPRHDAVEPRPRMIRTAAAGDYPSDRLDIGDVVPMPAELPHLREVFVEGAVVLERRHAGDNLHRSVDPRLARRLLPPGTESRIIMPLRARGLVLGVAVVVECREEWAGDEDDLRQLSLIASRAALAVDNARRYEREHRTAVILQRQLLPSTTTDTTAATTFATYLPAGRRNVGGGDWFDVIPLSSARVALVTGTVAGHGLRATATMGRLRSAMGTLAVLDLEPDELLTHLDDLVQRLDAESGDDVQRVRAACTYLVHDPVSGHCVAAGAGGTAPVVVPPGGPATLMPMRAGPALGEGGAPFEVSEWDVVPGTLVALYTRGLLDVVGAGPDDDPADLLPGMLQRASGTADGRQKELSEISADVLRNVGPEGPPGDVVLLTGYLKTVDDAHTAHWTIPARPELVASMRAAVSKQLNEWGLDDLTVMASELVISELVTNSVRYAGGSLEVRLIRTGHELVCEVSDPASTQPRLRRARTTDEGGRGLFLVAQMTERWGCRYSADGKTIWTEQSLAAPELNHPTQG
ncbi:ATP-binding SpoIIE family protein phosphatase [Streptomyces sp. AM 2-1-1]|uniref:ATP-binding SpoIIE family protein phosphatase n=1 Tax=Streptomyces sp. AM 2-1-1 TaxID=3028709 RepID=UPI0023B9FFEB|nr:ATP-binding SpoIIE family protein phosphatase [Streptomyces sp. AM 2-1-1]WEH38271.1 serine/threonine-protein phosphatase [Streptomyces sp. AM 2-1-1]